MSILPATRLNPSVSSLFDSDLRASIPAAAWSRGIGVPYENAGKPRVTEVPLVDDGPWGGVPLGGFGAGSIGRTYRGDFARWHLDIGSHTFESLPANQFSVFVQQGRNREAHVLSPLRPETESPSGILQDWNWDMPVGAGTYHALFPKAWFVYDWEALPVRLAQKQFSPVIPGNYQESSYPVGVFEWEVENPTDLPLTVGLMFTWQNLVGYPFKAVGDWYEQYSKLSNGFKEDKQPGAYNYAVDERGLTGVVFSHLRNGATAAKEWNGSFAILTNSQPGLTASYRTRSLLADGSELWADFAEDGRLDDVDDRTPAAKEQNLVGALAVTLELGPRETRRIPFALAWDFPITEFGAGTQWYKRYTKFFGVTGQKAAAIAEAALTHYPEWEAAIDAWQQPILDDPGRPDWYKTALFNELYYLVDGGSFWENGRVPTSQSPAPKNGNGNGNGHGPAEGGFAFLECYDYPFYNTFDVNFYASYSLLMLWPELEKRIIRDFAATVPMGDPTIVEIQGTGEKVARKLPGAVPHDLGGPLEDPLLRMNFYRWQDINIWKDLNCKFVLQLWRDSVFLDDKSLIHAAWPMVVQALDYLKKFDRDDDGLPEHDNLPDQTYDTWPMKGASAYGGSLWLAALEAAIKMGRLVGDQEAIARYSSWLKLGRAAFESKLWNGKYYLYDASGGPHSDSIMADQLAGQWYADATGLPPIAPADHVLSSLRMVYDYNVCRFGEGEMGAVNGMRPDGTVDTSSEQSQEVWTGTTYALAAFMLHRGLISEAWATAWGVYNVTYERGYWFRTPEAYDINSNFRATLYMRPLSIWAMEYALQQRAK